MKSSSLFAAVVIALVATFTGRAVEPALTIYNQGFAVLRETVPLDLHAGVNDVRFAGVTNQVEADSVILRDPSGKFLLQVLEQNYRNDPVSEVLLLSLFEGRTLEFVRHEEHKADSTVSGKVIRSGYVPGGQNVQPIVEVDGKLQFSLPGEPRFPALGDDTQLKPALSWKLNAVAPAKLDAELAYVTGGLKWEASYNVVSQNADDLIDIAGWVTMENTSGAAFLNARIKLMAGNVNKVQKPDSAPQDVLREKAYETAAPAVVEKSFDEFHLYTLERPTTLLDKETKQVEFIRAAGVHAGRIYTYDPFMNDGGYHWEPGQTIGEDADYGTSASNKVALQREFKNSEANHLGFPLPKGRVRFYQQDEDRRLEFIGENEIDHTPKEEMVRIYLGDSFDLAGERKRIDLTVNKSNHRASESFEIKLRNHKKTPVEIRVVEHLYRWRNWTVKEKSRDFKKTDAQTIEFLVSVKPDEEQTVTYQVNYSW